MKNLIQSILILTGVLVSSTGAEEVIYAKVGDTVTLRTPVTSGYVTWTFGNENDLQLAWSTPFGKKVEAVNNEWKDRLTLTDAGLVIKNIQQQNFGIFSKVPKNEAATTYKIIKLSVSRSPNRTLLPGETLTLTCDTEAPQATKPQIAWINPQGATVSGLIKGGKLTVMVTNHDHGQWTCVVTSDKKEQISVQVVDLSPAPSNHYTSESSRLNIPFSLLPGISWKEIKDKGIQGVQWKFFPRPSSSLVSEGAQEVCSLSLEDPLKPRLKKNQHRGLILQQSPQGNLSLTRRQVKLEDRGDYACILQFGSGRTINRTIRVEVLELASSPSEVISGHQVNLSCGLGHELPSDLRLKWIPPQNSSVRPLPSDHHLPRLSIAAAGSGDGGMWRCELWRRETLLTSAVITLKIEPRLSVWMLVTICAAIVILILICILVFIRRRRQRMTRHPRRRLCQCKIPKPKGFYRT